MTEQTEREQELTRVCRSMAQRLAVQDQQLAVVRHQRDRARAWGVILEQLLAASADRQAMLEDVLQRVTVERDELSEGPPWW